MTKLVGRIAALAFVGLIAGGGGFFLFAERVRLLTADPEARADGIVVLTGDEERIATGVRLMIEGRGVRMLISGVNPSTRV
ncbi:MAG: YdcF family protein, partial [Proteobacteria bacterium]|nr:YdcF family protein [Pseudomonadota bacterium]